MSLLSEQQRTIMIVFIIIEDADRLLSPHSRRQCKHRARGWMALHEPPSAALRAQDEDRVLLTSWEAQLGHFLTTGSIRVIASMTAEEGEQYHVVLSIFPREDSPAGNTDLVQEEKKKEEDARRRAALVRQCREKRKMLVAMSKNRHMTSGANGVSAEKLYRQLIEQVPSCQSWLPKPSDIRSNEKAVRMLIKISERFPQCESLRQYARACLS